jgi:PIN domain nuclease of toxin-antitoxin system
LGVEAVSVLLDTHAALWLVQGDARLSATARDRISALDRDEIFISDLMLFELGVLVSKQRVVIAGPLGPFLRDFSSHFRVLPVDAEIAAMAVELALPQADPFDRIFVATARRHTLPIVTRDREIRESAVVETIW